MATEMLQYPFVLRVTAWKNHPVPVLVVKKRRQFSAAVAERQKQLLLPFETPSLKRRMRLHVIGHIYGESLQRCLPVCKKILANVQDNTNKSLGLHEYLAKENLKVWKNLPLDEQAGAKLGLIFKLQSRVREMDRVELIAHRVAEMTASEAVSWLSRITNQKQDSNRWALMGLRTMLAGPSSDKNVKTMLAKLQDQ